MLKKSIAAMSLAAFMGTAGLEFAAVPASATVPYVAAPAMQADVNIQPAAWVYVKGKHGNRYVKKRPGYGYYYGGYWYAKPWWKVGGPKVWVYNPGKYGPRYKAKRHGYGYYYGGWYYPKPWWRY